MSDWPLRFFIMAGLMVVIASLWLLFDNEADKQGTTGHEATGWLLKFGYVFMALGVVFGL